MNNDNDSTNENYVSTTTVSREYVIRRLLTLPQLMSEVSRSIAESQHDVNVQINELELLENEFKALQAIVKII